MAMHFHMAAALEAIDSAAGGLSPDVVARPVTGKWSIAEILEHLTLAFTASAVAFDKAVESGVIKTRVPGFKQRVIRVVVVGLGYFPRVEAPEATRPRGSVPPERSVSAARDALIALDAAMTRFAERFGENTRALNHPYFAGLTIRQWRKFHWRHTVHHMRQVTQRRAKIIAT